MKYTKLDQVVLYVTKWHDPTYPKSIKVLFGYLIRDNIIQKKQVQMKATYIYTHVGVIAYGAINGLKKCKLLYL